MQKRGKKLESKKVDFLEKMRGLTFLGNVTMACQALGISRTQVYQWRNDDPKFAEEWDWATKEGVETRADETEQALRKAALEGNIKAIIFTLKKLKPEVYGNKNRHVDIPKREDTLKSGFVESLERLITNIKANESSRSIQQ